MHLSRIILLSITALPIPLVVLLSFLTPTDINIDIYWKSLFSSTYVTASLLFLTIFLALLWALPTAFICRFFAFRGQRLWAYLLILPIAIPSYLNGFIFSDLFYYTGHFTLWLKRYGGIDLSLNIHSVFGASLVLSLSLFPYIFFPLYMRLGSLPQNLFDVLSMQSRDFWIKVTRVALPFSIPIIIFSAALIGMETLADFGTTSFFGVNSLSVFIFNLWAQTSDSVFAIKMSFFFVIFIGSLLALEYWVRPLKNITGAYDIGKPYSEKVKLSVSTACLCNMICFIPFFFGFLLPFGYFLINTIFFHYDSILSALILLWSTAYPALFAAFLCVLTALLFAFWQKFEQVSIIQKILIAFSVSGYAFPGIILGLVLLMSTTLFDRTVNNIIPVGGTILSSSLFGLIFAYFLRFLTVAYGNIKPVSDQLSFSLFEASKLMGYNKFQIIKLIFLPLLQRPVCVAFILVFIDIVKELPATLLLRPFGFESLATHTYNMAGLEQIAESSPSALMIILFGMLACLIPFSTMNIKKGSV